MMFDIEKFKVAPVKHERYNRRINDLKDMGRSTEEIQAAVEGAINNLKQKNTRSFVIYGEPQSGKTEMMIALTARLLDENNKIIILLLNDSVQLLGQNLDRFKRSGLDPAPKNFNEILDPSVKIGDNEWVVFCKKNSKDLQKLLSKLSKIKNKIIIDDEADYATPNSKINKQTKTKINELVEDLIGSDGIYIGVTATPARLDLNNTFYNDNESWIDFPPHSEYKGANDFFPTSLTNGSALNFNLKTLSDKGDSPKYLRNALFRFLVRVAYLNALVNAKEEYYSILVHTSGKKADHTIDYKNIIKTFEILSDENNLKYANYIKSIFEIAAEFYPGHEDEITHYIIKNKRRFSIVLMNSDVDKNVVDFKSATSPATLFTIAIGGNIVSRGVTFDNLLSMFFTRDVKHKIQQDTYIQRARMFGTRGKYLDHFELTIPEHLYLDWHKCFIFHQLSLESIRAGNGTPVWLEDRRISAVAGASVDRTTVSMDSGEMGFEIFEYKEDIISSILSSDLDGLSKLKKLAHLLGSRKIPDFLIEYIKNFMLSGDKSISFHKTSQIENWKETDYEKIERYKGFISPKDSPIKDAIHHFKIINNSENNARIFYKYSGNIKFLRNLKQK